MWLAVRMLVGTLTVLATIIGVVAPVAIAGSLYGSNWGATVGAGCSVILQLALLVLIARFPQLPGAHIVFAICTKSSLLMLALAPIGAAIELIPADRATATWTGFAVGIGLVVLGLLALRLVPHRWRFTTSPLQRQASNAAAAGGAVGLTLHAGHHGGVDGGVDGGGFHHGGF